MSFLSDLEKRVNNLEVQVAQLMTPAKAPEVKKPASGKGKAKNK